jgi:crotonobetainyl-CoA:carnitine CoA-transferase CaiB-like acyl-CoA transferase
MSGPLSGLRVVDFSRVLAGPLCARTLQDLGAEVIKIEPPSPDVSRFAFPSTDGMSGYYAQQNAGKRNVSINLNLPGAYELALKLCDTADIVVENFRAGTLGFFGLDYETLSKRNPRLIYASITGYGQGGPWRSRMAYAPTVQAEAGFTDNSVRHYGDALTEPRTDSLSHGDVYTGLQAVIAILAALNSRQKTGRGQYVDVAMAATLLAINERAHVDLSEEDLGAEPAILGATDCSFFTGPQGEFFTVATSIVGSRTFPSWLRAMRRVDLLADPRFSTAAARRTNFGALHQIIQTWMRTFPAWRRWMHSLTKPKSPWARSDRLRTWPHRSGATIGALSSRCPTEMAANTGFLGGRGAFRLKIFLRPVVLRFKVSTTSRYFANSASRRES